MLENRRVADVEDEVAQRDAGKGQRQRQSASRGGHEEDAQGRSSRSDGQATRRDGAVLLDRMDPVRLHVEDVVEQVNRAGERAEQGEGGQGAQDVAGVVEVLGEHQRGDHKAVLHPLMGPRRLQNLERGARHLLLVGPGRALGGFGFTSLGGLALPALGAGFWSTRLTLYFL